METSMETSTEAAAETFDDTGWAPVWADDAESTPIVETPPPCGCNRRKTPVVNLQESEAEPEPEAVTPFEWDEVQDALDALDEEPA